MVQLPKKWIDYLVQRPETGMGYQVVTVILNDKRIFRQAVVQDGHVTQEKGHDEIPFGSDQIPEIVLTHEKWNFNADRR